MPKLLDFNYSTWHEANVEMSHNLIEKKFSMDRKERVEMVYPGKRFP